MVGSVGGRCKRLGELAAKTGLGVAQPAVQVQRKRLSRKAGRGHQGQHALVRGDIAEIGEAVGICTRTALRVGRRLNLVGQDGDPARVEPPIDKAFRQKA